MGSAVDSEMWRGLVSLVVSAAAVMGSPGPSTVSLTAVTAAFGIAGARHYLAGLVAGALAVLLLVAAGVVATLRALPAGGSILAVGSALYLFYLAARIAGAGPRPALETARMAPTARAGFLLAVLNPKAYLAIAAVFSGTTQPADVTLAVLAGMVVLIHLGWLVAGAALARALCDPASARVLNVLLGLLLAAAAAHELLAGSG